MYEQIRVEVSKNLEKKFQTEINIRSNKGRMKQLKLYLKNNIKIQDVRERRRIQLINF